MNKTAREVLEMINIELNSTWNRCGDLPKLTASANEIIKYFDDIQDRDAPLFDIEVRKNDTGNPMMVIRDHDCCVLESLPWLARYGDLLKTKNGGWQITNEGLKENKEWININELEKPININPAEAA